MRRRRAAVRYDYFERRLHPAAPATGRRPRAATGRAGDWSPVDGSPTEPPASSRRNDRRGARRRATGRRPAARRSTARSQTAEGRLAGAIRSSVAGMRQGPRQRRRAGVPCLQSRVRRSPCATVVPRARIAVRERARYRRGPRLLRGIASDDRSGVRTGEARPAPARRGKGCQWWSGRREKFVGRIAARGSSSRSAATELVVPAAAHAWRGALRPRREGVRRGRQPGERFRRGQNRTCSTWRAESRTERGRGAARGARGHRWWSVRRG